MALRRIHVDTDLGSDTDDLAALAMLLGLPDVEVVGITTCADSGGMRAGLTSFALRLAGRADIPLKAGAEGSIAGFRGPAGLPEQSKYWPEPIEPLPSRPGEALDLLLASVDQGATVVAIGPWTNLAMLEAARPGSLRRANVVVMGGHIRPVRSGFPEWVHDMDYNVQQDVEAARIVFERATPLIVPLEVTLEVPLARSHLRDLKQGDDLARLVAAQAEQHGADWKMHEMGSSYSGLPDDLLNFQYDVVACAVAAGQVGITVDHIPLGTVLEGGLRRFVVSDAGARYPVVTAVDADRLTAAWVAALVSSGERRDTTTAEGARWTA